MVFVVAAFAEAARLPFDLPEAEQELIGGYHTEYAGLKLLLFLVAEFLHMITAAFLIVILFFGGWHLWGVTGSAEDLSVTWFQAIARIVVLSIKVFGVILFFMMVRWSWPRFRFDQLMALAWKVLLPLGLVNLVAVAVMVEYGDSLKEQLGSGVTWLFAIGGWIVLVGAWVIAALVSPSHDDNSPRRSVKEFDVEAELYRMFQNKTV